MPRRPARRVVRARPRTARAGRPPHRPAGTRTPGDDRRRPPAAGPAGAARPGPHRRRTARRRRRRARRTGRGRAGPGPPRVCRRRRRRRRRRRAAPRRPRSVVNTSGTPFQACWTRRAVVRRLDHDLDLVVRASVDVADPPDAVRPGPAHPTVAVDDLRVAATPMQRDEGVAVGGEDPGHPAGLGRRPPPAAPSHPGRSSGRPRGSSTARRRGRPPPPARRSCRDRPPPPGPGPRGRRRRNRSRCPSTATIANAATAPPSQRRPRAGIDHRRRAGAARARSSIGSSTSRFVISSVRRLAGETSATASANSSPAEVDRRPGGAGW